MKLKIKSKLFLSFFLVVMLTVILGVVSYLSLSTVTNELFAVAKSNERITTDMLQMRRDEKDFFARSLTDPNFFKTGSSKYLKKFKASFENIVGEISVVRSFISDKEHLREVEKIQDLVIEYKKNFFKVVANERKKGFKDWGLIGSLRDSVHAIEQRLAELDVADELIIQMLLMRRHEKDYLLRNDTKYQLKLSQRASEFTALLESTNLESKVRTELIALVQDYQEKFDEVVAIDGVIGRTPSTGLIGEYRETIHRLQPLVESEARFLSDQVSAAVIRAGQVIMIVVLLTVFLGIGLAIFLAGRISTPLRMMSEAGNKIAGGDLNATIPMIETGDEVQEVSETMNLLIGALKFHMNK